MERPRQSEFSGQSNGEEGTIQKESSGNMQGWGSPQVFAWLHTCLKEAPMPGKETLEIHRRRNSESYTKL